MNYEPCYIRIKKIKILMHDIGCYPIQEILNELTCIRCAHCTGQYHQLKDGQVHYHIFYDNDVFELKANIWNVDSFNEFNNWILMRLNYDVSGL